MSGTDFLVGELGFEGAGRVLILNHGIAAPACDEDVMVVSQRRQRRSRTRCTTSSCYLVVRQVRDPSIGDLQSAAETVLAVGWSLIDGVDRGPVVLEIRSCACQLNLKVFLRVAGNIRA